AILSVRLAKDRELRAFVDRGRALLAADLAELALRPGELQRGSGTLRLVAEAGEREGLERAAEADPAWLGRWLEPRELAEVEPLVNCERLAGAYLSEEGYAVDADAYVTALLHDAAGSGATVSLGEGAVEVEAPASGEVAVRTPRRIVRADRLVVAAGAWSGMLPGLQPLDVHPVRGQMLRL